MNSTFFEHIKSILFQPIQFWAKLRSFNLSFTRFFLLFVFPVVGVFGICVFAGQSLSTMSTATVGYVLLYALLVTVIYLLAYYLSVLALNAIIPAFGGNKTGIRAATLIFYSAIPFYFSQMVVGLFPSLFFIKLLSLYSLYLFYSGCVLLIRPAKERQIAFFFVALLVTIGIHLLLFFLVVLPVLKVI